jgi:hypothetical protein
VRVLYSISCQSIDKTAKVLAKFLSRSLQLECVCVMRTLLDSGNKYWRVFLNNKCCLSLFFIFSTILSIREIVYIPNAFALRGRIYYFLRRDI